MNGPGLAFQVNTIWALLWFTTGALDLTAPLCSAFVTEESGESAANVTFFGFISRSFYQLLSFGFH